jgi:hypothetical protein
MYMSQRNYLKTKDLRKKINGYNIICKTVVILHLSTYLSMIYRKNAEELRFKQTTFRL